MRALALSIGLALALCAPAAAAPTSAQQAKFYDVCLGISSNVALCSCKADAAMALLDERFMGMVIAAMQGGPVPQGDYRAYNAYVAKSNQICKPNY